MKVPEKLLDSLEGIPGFDRERFTQVHEDPSPVVSIRLNPARAVTPEFPSMKPVPWARNAFYLANRPSFTLDPLLHGGAYYVQEASSMFLTQCFEQHADLSADLRVLDLCAAPGGKSTLIQSLLSDSSLLVSNEVIKSRVNVLIENIVKWGCSNVVVTNNDPRDFSRLPNFFDVMVVDAPCSGSGLFRRDADAVQEWSQNAVEMCSIRQQRILTDALPSLSAGGLLIYSTCSYSQEENEAVCDWLCDSCDLLPLPLNIDAGWGIVVSDSPKHRAPGYRFFPDRVAGEGFFVACFRKKNGYARELNFTAKQRLQLATRKETEVIRPWLADPSDFSFYHVNDEIIAVPGFVDQMLPVLHTNLYVKKAGVVLGKITGEELIPAHDLALSVIINKKLHVVSLNKDAALQYLRKEEVRPEGAPRGWALVQYEGLSLGWLKVLQNRANNYYPKEWRIRKTK